MSSEELDFEESEFEGLNGEELEELKDMLLNLFDLNNSGYVNLETV